MSDKKGSLSAFLRAGTVIREGHINRLMSPRKKPPTLDSDEVFADAMVQASPEVARMLGCCPVCWEDMQVVDGKWTCLACEAKNETVRES